MGNADSPNAADSSPRPDHRPDDRHEAFVRLLMEHEGRVRGFLRGLLPSWNDVDEVIQQASIVAWRKFPEFDQQTNFGGWLLVIARYEALKHRRRLARSPLVFSEEVWELLANEAEPAHAAEAIDRRRTALEHCLDKLGAEQRRLLLETHTPGVRLNEIARRAGRSEQAFYKVVQRLRAAVLDCMRGQLVPEGAP
jgi:RNA polymerase sigma-70 factor (ECF subfamily)